MTAEIHHIWNVLHQDCKGQQFSNVVKVSEVEITSGIAEECLGVLVNFSQFCSTNPCKCLAGWTSNDDVDAVLWCAAYF
jgi:hypothetical protein